MCNPNKANQSSKLETCPFCKIEGTIEYFMWTETHIWKCTMCPFVCFEFIGGSSFRDLKEVLEVV